MKEKAMNIALNKISGDWDQQKLEVILEEIELSDIDVKLTGFEEIILEEIPDFQPVEFDGKRLDEKAEYYIKIYCKDLDEQDEIYLKLINEGYDCQKN